MKHAVRAAMAALALILLTACGGSDHNDADVTFAQHMVPHHQQAVEMSRLAETNLAGPEVLALAQRIEKAQGPEITTMKKWLADWKSGHDGHDTGGDDHASMDGMMSDGDLEALKNARGPEFDRLFLTQMIAHHEGAVAMAKKEQADGKYDAAITLAKAVRKSQTAEIAEMRKLLA